MHDDDAAKTHLQPNIFASNQRAQDGYREAQTHPRTDRDTHTSRLSLVLCRWSNLEGGNHKAKATMTMLRKLFCNQTFLQATNARRTDAQRHRHSPGRIDTHTSPLSLVLSPAGAS